MYYIILSVAVLVMLYVMITYVRIKKMPEGTPMMIKLAGIIRGGSKTFLRIQFRTVAVVVVFLAIVFSLFIETWSGLTFLLGATMSTVANTLVSVLRNVALFK